VTISGLEEKSGGKRLIKFKQAITAIITSTQASLDVKSPASPAMPDGIDNVNTPIAPDHKPRPATEFLPDVLTPSHLPHMAPPSSSEPLAFVPCRFPKSDEDSTRRPRAA
jgi:hypothetical protein